jgi:signal transduction histidine kinase
MRRLLGVLREDHDSEPLEPQPSLAELDTLIARVEEAGLPVSLELEGDPHLLDEGVQVTVYRVVQEALTNTLKHAREPTGAHVRLLCRPAGSLVLEVSDDGRFGGVADFVTTDTAQTTRGRGLMGMRERATACGGTIEAGPSAEGGWRIRLQIVNLDRSGVS